MLRGFYNGSTIKTSGSPSDEQLELINSRLEKPLTKDEVFVFRAAASNNHKDSYHSRMAPSSLKNYAEDAKEGRAFMNSHRTNERPTGRTFNAEYDADNKQLFIDTYVLRGLKLNETPTDDFIRGIEGGMIQDVSIRFSLGDEGREVCRICSKDLSDTRCVHVPGLEYEVNGKRVRASYDIEDAHLSEVSDVYKGSTPNAGIMRKARQMFRRGLLDDKQMRILSKQLDQRTIQGEEFLLFDFEKEGLDDDDGPDGDQPSDPSPVTNLKKNNIPQDNLANDKPSLSDRGLDLNKTEREALIKIYTRQIEDDGADLDPDYVKEVNEALTKWRADEDSAPPFMKKKKKDDESKEDEPRFLSPKNKNVRFDDFIRALGSGKGNEALPLPEGGNMEPGKGHDAGMLMEGLDQPLANVASSMFETENAGGGEVPTDADIIKGLQELNSPALVISPSGAMFLMNGAGSVSNGVGIGTSGGGLMVPMGRSEHAPVEVNTRIKYEGKDVYRYQPITIRLDDVDNVRALVHAAIDGGKYRRSLADDIVEYGRKIHGKSFDEDTYREVSSAMSTDKLETFRKKFRAEAAEHFRTHKPEDLSVGDFDGAEVRARQTVVKGTVEKPNKETPVRNDPHDNPDLYKS